MHRSRAQALQRQTSKSAGGQMSKIVPAGLRGAEELFLRLRAFLGGLGLAHLSQNLGASTTSCY